MKYCSYHKLARKHVQGNHNGDCAASSSDGTENAILLGKGMSLKRSILLLESHTIPHSRTDDDNDDDDDDDDDANDDDDDDNDDADDDDNVDNEGNQTEAKQLGVKESA